MHAQLSINFNIANVSYYPQPNLCLWNSELAWTSMAVVCTNRNMFVNSDDFFCISVSELAHATRKMCIYGSSGTRAFIDISSELILFDSIEFWHTNSWATEHQRSLDGQRRARSIIHEWFVSGFLFLFFFLLFFWFGFSQIIGL